MSAADAADEIRKELKQEYPQLYTMFWGNRDKGQGLYYEYYKSLEPEKLDFCIKGDGKIEVYDTWKLDYATNPNGCFVYITLCYN